ncbi:MAG: adenylate kinase [Chloroflexi bacterium RBG_16_50_9]|nr:MAG: adenylate kinase [Chloroflexi bacterium RBG_16_50_9]
MYIILLGAPGAGKGTQAVLLVEKLKLVQVASGDLFRQALQQKTELGIKAKTYMEKGQLVPDEITIQMVLERLSAPDCKKGAILDGFPRNTEQAKALDKALAQQSKAIDMVIYIKISEEELLKRLGGRWICRNCQTPYHAVDAPPRVEGRCDRCGGELYQRPDDKIETVKKRLEIYFKETSPLINHYWQMGKLVEINGEAHVNEVNERILTALHWGGA